MEVSHTFIPEGVSLSFSRLDRDEIYWIEKGELASESGDGHAFMTEHEFLFVPAGEQCKRMTAATDCIVLRWAAVVV